MLSDLRDVSAIEFASFDWFQISTEQNLFCYRFKMGKNLTTPKQMILGFTRVY